MRHRLASAPRRAELPAPLRRLLCGGLPAALVLALLAPAAGATPLTLHAIGPAFPTGNDPEATAFSPDGKIVVTANQADDTVSVFSVGVNGALIPKQLALPAGDGPSSLSFNHDGTLLAVGEAMSGDVQMFFVSGSGLLDPVGSAMHVSANVAAIAFNHDGRYLATANRDVINVKGEIKIYTVATNGEMHPASAGEPLTGMPNSLAFSARDHLAVTTDYIDATRSIYRMDADGRLTRATSGRSFNSDLCALAFNPVGTLLAVSDCYHQYDEVLIDAINGDGTISAAVGHAQLPRPAAARSVSFSPNGKLLATGNEQGHTVSLFTVADSGALAPAGAPVPAGSPSALAFGRGGTLLAVADAAGNNLLMYNVADDGGLIPVAGVTPDHGPQPKTVVFSPDQRLLATATDLFTVAPQGQLRSIGYPPAADFGTSALAFSPDAKLLVRSTGAEAVVFTVGAGGALTQIGSPVNTGDVPAEAVFSPDGAFLVCANANGTVAVFQVAPDGGLTSVGPPVALGGGLNDWTFNPDGDLLAAVNESGSFVSVFGFSPAGALTLHGTTPVPSTGLVATGPRSVAFSRNGKLLVTANAGDGTVATFTVGTGGALVFAGRATVEGARAAVFAPTGTALAAVSASGLVSLFSVQPDGRLDVIGSGADVPSRQPTDLAISPDGGLLAMASDDGSGSVTILSLAAPWLAPKIVTSPGLLTSAATATFTLDTNYPSTLECRLDAAPFAPCASPWTIGHVEDGRHRFVVRGRDLAGNAQSLLATWTWKVDTTQPQTTTLSVPADGAAGLRADGQRFAWTPTADEVSGIDHYELWIDGQRARTVPTSACGSDCSVVLGDTLPDGRHTWAVRAVDGAGNSSQSASRAFSVDATPPAAFAPASPRDGAWLTTPRPQLTWSPALDDSSGLAGYDVVLDEKEVESGLPVSTTDWTPAIDLADGTHSWHVVAHDVNGNARSSVTSTFTVDTTPPVPALVIAPNPALSGRDVTFDASGSADGPIGAITGYEWDFDGDGLFETSTSGPIARHAYTTTAALTVPVTVRVADRVGLTATVVRSARVFPQSTPKPPGITVDDQARYTNDEHVTVNIIPPSFATDVEVSNDGSFLSAESFKVTPTVPWRLDTANAEHEARTVYVRFKRGFIVSDQYTDDVILDRKSPVLKSASTTVRKGQTVLQVKANDVGLSGIGGVQVTNDKKHPPEDYTDATFRAQRAEIKLKTTGRAAGAHRSAASGSTGLPIIDRRKAIFVRVRDRAGNVSGWKRVRG